MLLRTLALTCLAGTLALADPVIIRARQNGSHYPKLNKVPQASETPKEWTDALNAAIAAGKIPNIPPSVAKDGGDAHYPNHLGNKPWVCSWTTIKCLGKHDIVDAPAGQFGVSFDDGPTPVSGQLYDFLGQQNQSATHFMIGSNVVSNEAQFQQAVKMGDQHFAVHTWSHQMMTTLSNEQVLAELGWTMQAIADKSGGYIPRFWRPPYGDVDNRVRAIAEEVFGLYNVLWNQDTNDWCLHDNAPSECPKTDLKSVTESVNPWINGPKDPGLIILEHELSHESIGVFINYFPRLRGLGWTTKNIPDLFNMAWYKNAKNQAEKPVQSSLVGAVTDEDFANGKNSTTTPTKSGTSGMTKAVTSTKAGGNQNVVSPTSTASNTPKSNGAANLVVPSAGAAAMVLTVLVATLL